MMQVIVSTASMFGVQDGIKTQGENYVFQPFSSYY